MPTSDAEFTVAVRDNSSMAGTLRSLGVVPRGGNYGIARNRIKRLALDTSHWIRGQQSVNGPRSYGKRALEDILVENSTYSTSSLLKKRLIAEGLLEEKCAECEISEWRGRPLSLHLDHINGRKDDHRIENLRLLCPNCHSQTATYAGRNMNGGRRKVRQCIDCKVPISKSAKRCQPCSFFVRRVRLELTAQRA